MRYDEGRSVGLVGSEEGVILLDDEHTDGARITLERDGHTAPFSITCGVYGWMVHTRFFGEEAEARGQFDAMKVALSDLVRLNVPEADGGLTFAGDEFSKFVDRFP
ncbi:MAG TPA: hypothetical protein VH394_03145 [Thermoanaerobaculia bacterium]|nr:hypothetical protein [Thermoanaerobaculia bacterium]